MTLETYTLQLEEVLEEILEHFDLQEDFSYDMFDYEGNPVKVSDDLADAIIAAEKLLYSTEGSDEDYS